jgi:hypothetical protein
MNRTRLRGLGGHGGRLFTAAALGLAALASCAGAAPASGTPPQVEPITGPATDDAIEAAKRVDHDKHEAPDAGPPADAGPGKGEPRCPYGELSDPHRGFVRCLAPDERDAGWLPPQPQAPPPSPDAPAAKDPTPAPTAPPAAAGPPPLVDIGSPKFENGEVPRAEKALTKAATEIASCVADHGGLNGATGTIKVQFLVRNRGRAEGVEILSSKGVSPDAAACVRVLLKNKPIGPPSADPVGVTVTISLKPPAK